MEPAPTLVGKAVADMPSLCGQAPMPPDANSTWEKLSPSCLVPLNSARMVGADALDTQPAETDFVERFLDREQAQQIYRHVHELGAQYKEVFLLRTLGELSFRDIADIFGKSESWAKVTYFRAKSTIIERMEGST